LTFCPRFLGAKLSTVVLDWCWTAPQELDKKPMLCWLGTWTTASPGGEALSLNYLRCRILNIEWPFVINLCCALFFDRLRCSVSYEPLRIFLMTIHTPRHECLAYCPRQAEKQVIQPVVDNTRGTRVERAASPFPKIFRGS